MIDTGSLVKAFRSAPFARQRSYGLDKIEHYPKYLAYLQEEQIPLNESAAGDWEYTFNSLGFRGEEIDLGAGLKVFAFGASSTFGTGVKWEQTWPYLLAHMYGEQLGINSINCVSFAEGAAPNDFIARMLVSQCAVVKPDLAVALMAPMNRRERFEGEKIQRFIPQKPSDKDSLRVFEAYLEWQSPETDFVNWAFNVLIMQNFCKVRNIPLIIVNVTQKNEKLEAFAEFPALAALLKQVIENGLTVLPPIRLDLARDLSHPGPKSMLELAKKIFELNGDVLNGFSTKKVSNHQK